MKETNYIILCEEPTRKSWKYIKSKNYLNYIGIDKGAYFLLKNKIETYFISGDFDDMSANQRRYIDNFYGEKVYLSPEKDTTDLEYAVQKLDDKKNQINAYVKDLRKDHFINQILLINKYNNLKIIGDNYEMFMLKKGRNSVKKDRYTFFGLFSLDDSLVSIDRAKYNIDNNKIDKSTTFYTSNEWKDTDADITVKKGNVLIVKNLYG